MKRPQLSAVFDGHLTMDKQLADGNGLLLEMYEDRAFCRAATARFPELATELQADGEGPHIQMAVLGRAVGEALARGDESTAERVCGFVEEGLRQPRAIAEIANAVCFMEEADFQSSSQGPNLWQRLPARVKALLVEQAERCRRTKD